MNNYKRLETRIKNLEQKKQKKELIISKAQDEIKEYIKQLKELYSLKEDIAKVSNKLDSFFANEDNQSEQAISEGVAGATEEYNQDNQF